MGSLVAPIAAGVSGIGSLIGGLLGSGAASKAANQQRNYDNTAIGTLQTAGNSAGSVANQYMQGQMANLDPYKTLGTVGLAGLTTGEAPGGQFATSAASLTPQQILAQNPGYNFQLQQGSQAITRNAAAQGTGITGGELKDLTDYSQGLAQTAYQQAYNNFNTTQSQQYAMLTGLSNIGQSAANTENTDMGQFVNNYSNDVLGTQGQIANIQQQEGGVQAAGILGSANSLNNGISGLLGGASQAANLYNTGQTFSIQAPGGANPATSAATGLTGTTNYSGVNLPTSSTIPSAPLGAGVNNGDFVGLSTQSTL